MADKKRNWLNPEDEATFTLVDEATVERLQKRGVVTLPKKKVDIPKDMAWNKKTLNSMLLQGIQNGDGVDKIAGSIFPEIMSKTDLRGKSEKEKQGIIKKNRESAIRNARTMATEAECGGRQDSYEELEEQGVVQKKVWIATPDDRTRESHLMLDGEEVDVDEPFSNGCMYPGDPSGPPEEVWNCRCSIRTHIIGFRREDGSVSEVKHERDETMHERQMEEEKERRASEAEYELEAEEVEEAETVSDVPYTEKIKEIQERIKRDGLKDEDVREAGQVMSKEINAELAERQAKLDDAKAEFKKIDDELNKLKDDEAFKEADRYIYQTERAERWGTTPPTSERFNNIDEAKAYKDEVQAKIDELKQSDAYIDAKEKYWEAKRDYSNEGNSATELLSSKLSEVREIGYPESKADDIKHHLSDSRSPARKDIEYAYQHYPASWVEQSAGYSKILPQTVQRGYYSDSPRVSTVALSGYSEESKRECAFHELGHRFEKSVPGIRDAEEAFYNKRTAGEELKWLGSGYRRDEKTRFDNFIDSYMGKDYGGDAYELVSMGFEYAYTNPALLAKDPDMQEWILGLLTVVP